MMFDKRELIYSRHFPRTLLVDIPEDVWQSEEEAARSLKKFKNRLYNESKIVPWPERQAGKEEFIRQLKKLSNIYAVDLEIYQRDFFVEAILELRVSTYPKNFMKRLSALMEMGDQLSVFVPRGCPDRVRLHLDYYTHHFYFGERCVTKEE